jgi:hypothetical protein
MGDLHFRATPGREAEVAAVLGEHLTHRTLVGFLAQLLGQSGGNFTVTDPSPELADAVNQIRRNGAAR